MSKLFNLNPRKPTTLSEEAARKLEAAIEAKGEGVAGQSAPVLVAAPAPVAAPQAHELTSSAEPAVEAAKAESAAIAARAASETPEPAPIVELAAQPIRNPVSSRTRSVTKSRARELPTTGVGTLHNPRVRKTDGVKTRSTTVHLPVELAQKLAVHCAMSGRKQSEVIAEAVEAILG